MSCAMEEKAVRNRRCNSAFEKLEQRTLMSVVSPATIGPPYQLAYNVQPGNGVAGQVLPNVVVEVESKKGHVETGDNSDVTIEIWSYPGSVAPRLFGTVVQQAHGGIAIFNNLAIDLAGGGFTFGVYDTGDSIGSAAVPLVSDPFTIDPGPAAYMEFDETPAKKITPTAEFNVQVELFDQYGNVATNDDSTVTLTELHSSAVDNLVTADVEDGYANFDDLTLGLLGNWWLQGTDSNNGVTPTSVFKVDVVTKLPV